jgi:hypothetical protein
LDYAEGLLGSGLSLLEEEVKFNIFAAIIAVFVLMAVIGVVLIFVD